MSCIPISSLIAQPCSDNQSDSAVSADTLESKNVKNVEMRICKLCLLNTKQPLLVDYCFGKVTKIM